MKLSIMTLDRRVRAVEFDESKTVWALKVHLCKLRGVWVRPETQQLLYAGQILKDKDKLRTYSIDERKFLLMLTKAKSAYKTLEYKSIRRPRTGGKSPRRHTSSPVASLKQVLMDLGPWTESEVQSALLVAFNNSERAIQYLVEGIPLFPVMVKPPPSKLLLRKRGPSDNTAVAAVTAEKIIDEMETTYNRNKTAFFKAKPKKRVKFACETRAKSKIKSVRAGINVLADIGFPRDLVYRAYKACGGNIEQTADLLFQQYRDKDPRDSSPVYEQRYNFNCF